MSTPENPVPPTSDTAPAAVPTPAAETPADAPLDGETIDMSSATVEKADPATPAPAAVGTDPAADQVSPNAEAAAESVDPNPQQRTTAPVDQFADMGGESIPSQGDLPAIERIPLRPDELRPARLAFLNGLVQAVLLTTPRPSPIDVLDSKRAMLDQDTIAVLVTPLAKLQKFPAPQAGDLAAIAELSSIVLSLHRAFFSTAKPSDQSQNDLLLNLTNSVAIPPILAKLSQTGGLSQDPLTTGWLDANIDGHQSRELTAVGVDPRSILPLLGAIGYARVCVSAAT